RYKLPNGLITEEPIYYFNFPRNIYNRLYITRRLNPFYNIFDTIYNNTNINN
ncbi:hypothetical protein B0H65DRAFT_421503, partial [Neurospora tetraspora]